MLRTVAESDTGLVFREHEKGLWGTLYRLLERLVIRNRPWGRLHRLAALDLVHIRRSDFAWWCPRRKRWVPDPVQYIAETTFHGDLVLEAT